MTTLCRRNIIIWTRISHGHSISTQRLYGMGHNQNFLLKFNKRIICKWFHVLFKTIACKIYQETNNSCFVIKIKCKKEKQFLQMNATEKTTRYVLLLLWEDHSVHVWRKWDGNCSRTRNFLSDGRVDIYLFYVPSPFTVE